MKHRGARITCGITTVAIMNLLITLAVYSAQSGTRDALDTNTFDQDEHNDMPSQNMSIFPSLEQEKFLNHHAFPRASCDCTRNKVFKRDSGKIYGFYNIFRKNETVFNRIVSEQIQTLEASGLLSASQSIEVVFFGEGAETFKINSSSPKYIRSPMTNTTGGETTTLHRLHSHCLRNPSDRVFYIHSKGTFNPRDAQEILRRNNIKAIVDCWTMGGLEHSDVCGLRVSPLPHPHFSGNMWWARCQHVARLPDPLGFEAQMRRFLSGPSQRGLASCHPSWLGADRWAAEHWILSHPAAVAADVLPAQTAGGVFTWWEGGLASPSQWQAELHVFPRPDLPALAFFPLDRPYVKKDLSLIHI